MHRSTGNWFIFDGDFLHHGFLLEFGHAFVGRRQCFLYFVGTLRTEHAAKRLDVGFVLGVPVRADAHGARARGIFLIALERFEERQCLIQIHRPGFIGARVTAIHAGRHDAGDGAHFGIANGVFTSGGRVKQPEDQHEDTWTNQLCE